MSNWFPWIVQLASGCEPPWADARPRRAHKSAQR